MGIHKQRPRCRLDENDDTGTSFVISSSAAAAAGAAPDDGEENDPRSERQRGGGGGGGGGNDHHASAGRDTEDSFDPLPALFLLVCRFCDCKGILILIPWSFFAPYG